MYINVYDIILKKYNEKSFRYIQYNIGIQPKCIKYV